MSSTLFSELPLSPALLDNLVTLGFTQMTPIQKLSLPSILGLHDVLGQAATGSGKTAAFGLGLLAKLRAEELFVQALVVCPTRELAEQVSTALRKFARRVPNIKIATLCGGSPTQPQITALMHGVHCVVGTPGRIRDLVRRRHLDLRAVETLVLDEADRMLDMGFIDEIMTIVEQTPTSRQTLLFSATMPEHMHELVNEVQKNPVFIKDDQPKELSIEERFYLKNDNELELVAALLGHYQPKSALVFCNTKKQCTEIADALMNKGFCAMALHGDLEQRERDEALLLFSNNSLSVLVATDVASRGLDINDLSMVINVDVARDPDDHVHRIGRTGRAGKKGFAVTLFSQWERARLNFDDSAHGTVHELTSKPASKPSMATMRISCGRKNKLRAGDILGALTSTGAFTREDVGVISLGETHSFVAVAFHKADEALRLLNENPIKGKFLKTTYLVVGRKRAA